MRQSEYFIRDTGGLVLNVSVSQWFKRANPTAATLSRKTPPYCFMMLDFKMEAPKGFRL